MDKLVFNLVPPPPLEAFFWFPTEQVKWESSSVKEVDGSVVTEWGLRLSGRKPDLHKLLQPLRNRLSRQYPKGYFIYRWKLEFGSYGKPVLHLHLIGDLGPTQSLEAVTGYLTRAWLTLTNCDPSHDDLVRVQATHKNSLGNFSKGLDQRLATSLERLLGDRFEFGKIGTANMPIQKPLRVKVTDEQLETILQIVLQHIKEYSELRDVGSGAAWRSWGRAKFLRALSEANYGNVFLNEVTGPQVRAVLGLE